MAGLAKAGRRVVRLKVDVASANRTDGEIGACRKAGIAIDIVPGVGTPSTRVPDAVQRVA